MDLQIGLALDRIRESQWHQNAMLEAIAQNQLRNLDLLTELLNRRNGQAYIPQPPIQSLVSEPTKLSGFFKGLASNGVQTAAQWLAGMLAMAYVVRGGDVGSLLTLVLKSLAGG